MSTKMPLQHKNDSEKLKEAAQKEALTRPVMNSEGVDPKRQEKLNEELIEATFTRGVSKK